MEDVAFRRLTDGDLRLLHRWLNEPGVVRWWEGDDVSWNGVVRDYGAGSADPTEHWLALLGRRPVGWIQCYAAASYPDTDEVQQWWRCGVPRTAGGIDYLIGDPGDRGRGLGTAMIRTFVETVMAPRHPWWDPVCASPVAANVASWRALEKAGFRHAASFGSTFGECRLMMRRHTARRAHG